MTTDKPNIIETQHLSRKFGEFIAVENVSLAVPSHSIYGFLGSNGAGKTTTIRMLLGLLRPTTGDICIFGQDARKHRQSIMRKVGSLVEQPTIYSHLSGYDNLRITRRLLDLPQKRIEECLDIVNLTGAAHRRAGSYSQGMKQRLGLANALLNQPKLLILDEPTNGLDPAGIREIRELIRILPEQFNTSIFLSSHLLSEIQQVATHIGIIQKGSLIFQSTMADLQSQQQKQLRIRIPIHQIDAAREILNEEGYTTELTDDQQLLIKGQVELVYVVQRLADYQIEIINLEYGVQSLEDLFINLTKVETTKGII